MKENRKEQKTRKQENKKARKQILLFCFFAFLLFCPPTAHAGSLLPDTFTKKAGESAGYAAATTETTLAATLGNIVNAVLSLLGIFFMALMVYAGYLWMSARGDETRIEKAQTIIRGAIIGLIIIMGSYAITNFVVPAVLEKTTGQGGAATPVEAPRPGARSGVGSGPEACVWVGALSGVGDSTLGLNRTDCQTWCQREADGRGTALRECTLNGVSI